MGEGWATAQCIDQRIASAQVAAAHADQQRIRIGPDVEPVEPDFELGAIAGLDRCVVGSRRIGELRLRHIRSGAPGNLEHAGVVDPERAGRVSERQLGMRTDRPLKLFSKIRV